MLVTRLARKGGTTVMAEQASVQDRKVLWQRDFNENPFIVIWEVTRACQLHCLHCRAEAQRHRDPRELSTAEGFRLIDQIAEMDNPLLVFTGGDPLEREDLYDFIRYARKKGLEIGMTPSATPRVTKDALARVKEAGLTRCAFSIDGSTAAIHDKFRGTKGSYDLTVNALKMLQELDIPIQLNTTVSRYNLDDLENLANFAEQFGTVLWSVFFLVPTGRAKEKDMITADECEQVMEWLYEQAKVRPFGIKTTAAPHYRRVVMQHRRAEGATAQQQRDFLIHADSLRSAKSVNDGNGFLFVSHIGEVYPSGFLPVVAGNIRQSSLVDLYRNSPVFQELRNPSLLKGKCGRCEFRYVCGGSRARAYGITGDYLESDPTCSYQPSAQV